MKICVNVDLMSEAFSTSSLGDVETTRSSGALERSDVHYLYTIYRYIIY